MQTNCPKCDAIINLSPTPPSNVLVNNMENMLFEGNCHCDNQKIYVCKCCKEKGMSEVNRGRPTSWLFNRLFTIKQHARSTSHKSTLKSLASATSGMNARHLFTGTSSLHSSDLHQPPLTGTEVMDDEEDFNITHGDDALEVSQEFDSAHEDTSGGIIESQQSKTKDDWLLHINHDLLHAPRSLDELKEHGFDEESKSPIFFWHEHENPGKGAQFLTAKAFELPVDAVTIEEAQFSLTITSLLLQLTETQRELFAECMLQAVNSKDKDLSIFKRTRPPTTIEDFEELYLSKSKSIVSNLPHPVPKTTDDGTHAYVSLKDLLANELAKATTFDKFEFTSKVVLETDDEPRTKSCTPAAYDLFMELKGTRDDSSLNSLQHEASPEKFILYLWISEWRDDFDPNNTKSSRNQVWVNTYTICPPGKDSNGDNTFFVSLGSKGDDHSGVVTHVRADCESMKEVPHFFFHGGLGKYIEVRIAKLSTCVDRPERCSMFQIGDHNGTYSTLWEHATLVDRHCQQNHLPSCADCRKQNVLDAIEENVPVTASINVPAGNALCPQGKCSCWNVLDPTFRFPVPKHYPTTCDNQPTAPQAPKGREIRTNKRTAAELMSDDADTLRGLNLQTTSHCLQSVRLTIKWLKEALIFAHHNMKTRPPNSRSVNKRYWAKNVLTTYLRTCGISGQLIDSVVASAKRGDAVPPFPASWLDENALSICHYAPMHLLFLGHISSDYDMTSKFLSKYKVLATSGRQANIYLKLIQNLQVTRWFGAHPLSTSSWGTGVWVSENYLFWARAIKFFATLPSLHNARLLASNAEYLRNFQLYLRFVSATHYCMCKVMSSRRFVPKLETSIKVYMDTMVEFDRWLFTVKEQQKNADVSTFGSSDNTPTATTRGEGQEGKTTAAPATTTTARATSAEATATALVADRVPRTAVAPRKKTRKMTRILKPNFVKSNSLGLLSAAAYHAHTGPAIINWDGGWSGERKIQQVKPLLGIKHSNAAWQRITLTTLYQNDTINWLMASLQQQDPRAEDLLCSRRDRSMEGTVKVYKTFHNVQNAISENRPLVGVTSKDGKRVWVLYRPDNREGKTRSSIDAMEISFDDTNGCSVHSICWFAPVQLLTQSVKMLESVLDLPNFVNEYVLLLPQMVMKERNECVCVNQYYCIGHKWTERNETGDFISSKIDSSIFDAWINDTGNNSDAEEVGEEEDDDVDEVDADTSSFI